MNFLEKVPRNPYLIFLPFLIFFVVYGLASYNDAIEGDEGRYLRYTDNLTHGFYSAPMPDIDLWSGPGYSLLLVPFHALHLPRISLVLLNAAAQYMSIVLLFLALTHFTSFGRALAFGLFWAFCYTAYKYIPTILTESVTMFLVSLLVYTFVKAFSQTGNRYVYAAGLAFGYLVLTKIIFGYVVMLMLAGTGLWWIVTRKRAIEAYRKGAMIMLIAFAVTVPYLVYTFSLTGKPFYWGNSGGSALYWMTSPYENEYGDWNNEFFTSNLVDGDITGTAERLKKTHQKDMDEARKYVGVEKDAVLKRMSFENIKNHPVKYAQNILSNISRAFFGFPGTYTFQRPMNRTWYFAILYGMMLGAIVITTINWKSIDYSVRLVITIAYLYLGLSFLVSADNRQLMVIVPALIFHIAYVTERALTIKLFFDKRE